MIDIENKVFDTVCTSVKEKFPNANVVGETVEEKAKFPAVVLNEIVNNPYSRSATVDSPENHATVTYEVNIYSDKRNGNKQECKDILQVVDDTFQKKLFFTRRMVKRLPNQDRTIYRLYARYTAVVGQPKTIDGDIVYPLYRK